MSVARLNFWAVFTVITALTSAMLWGLWPEGQSFEQATGLIDVAEWHTFKFWAFTQWKTLTGIFR